MTTPGPQETAVRELYADDPFTDSAWFGRMIADAQESDRTAAYWAERAEAEEEELDDVEEFEL